MGELEETETFDTIPDVPECGEVIGSWHQVAIEEDNDRLVFHGRFERGSLVMVLLKNATETRGYFINTAASYHLAMCSGAYLEDDERTIKQNISKRGLSGCYDLKVLVEDKIFETGVRIFCES